VFIFLIWLMLTDIVFGQHATNQPLLVFGAASIHQPNWFIAWKQLDYDPQQKK
jgi:hypothetical protein